MQNNIWCMYENQNKYSLKTYKQNFNHPFLLKRNPEKYTDIMQYNSNLRKTIACGSQFVLLNN